MSSETAADTEKRVDRPAAPFQTESFCSARPQIVGPDSPELPFPISLVGCVQRGFGRGGKDLGCPTANLPDESLPPISSIAKTGIYFGFAQVIETDDEKGFTENRKVFPMVMSLGLNPFYKNERLTAEIHIMHEFTSDFYGYEMRAIVLGYIRPELDYTSRGSLLSIKVYTAVKSPIEALIDDIEVDKKVALNSLARPGYQKFVTDAHFLSK